MTDKGYWGIGGKTAGQVALVVAVFVAPYCVDVWWKYLASCLGIVALMAYWQPASWRSNLGLAMSPLAAYQAGFLFLAVATVAHESLALVGASQGVQQSLPWGLEWQTLPFAQALGEEMLLRGWLLTHTLKIWPHKKQLQAVLLWPAMLFSLLHWIAFLVLEGKALAIAPLVTLFFFGYATNTFFYLTGNIGVPWALHAGWNAIKFGQGDWYRGSEKVSVAQGFGLFEGHWSLVVGSGVLALVAWVMVYSKRRT